MGNSLPLPPCVCCGANDDEPASTAGTKRSNRERKTTACMNGRAAARHVVPVDMPEESGNGEEEEKEGIEAAWPVGWCRLEPPVAVVGHDSGVVRVKIVMKRKEVEELVSMLEQRDAAERRKAAGMDELGGGSVAVTMMSPCRDAWRPRLASIPENFV